MEYISHVESLEDEIAKFNCSFSKLKEDKDDCVVEDSCDFCVNDSISIYSSSDDELYGFDTPKKDKHSYILNLIKKIELETNEDTDFEKDIIDGVEFLSFSLEQELMDYAKAQQDLRANASQSDDGLEILDDGTFSDISSNHAIVPTKTKDITRIKGWRNKHFAGINVCDDSGSSMRNEDDGFGDDFEIKSVQDESSEELESVGYAASTTSKSGFDGDASHEKNFKRIDSPVIEDTNAVDNAEGFTCQKSNKTVSSSFLNSSVSQKSFGSNSSRYNALDFSFDNFDIKGIFTSDNLSSISAVVDQTTPEKNGDYFLSPLTPQDRKCKNSFDNKVVYKPRVKQGFLDRLVRKVSAENYENVMEDNIATSESNKKVEKLIRWCVPKDKLLSGNIYDVEVSLSSDSKVSNCKITDNGKSSGNSIPEFCQKESLNKEGESKAVTRPAKIELADENIAAFQSTTLEHFTTNLDRLHIDFTIPKLDAADNVTHEDVVLPVPGIITKFQQKQKPKPLEEVRAKTVAEKRRLLSELSLNQRTKRKQKLSYKMRANNEIKNSKRVKRLRGRIEKNTQKAKMHDKMKPLEKKIQKSLFDEQGVLKYGREKPLKSAISKSFITMSKLDLSYNVQKCTNSSNNSSIGMILNIGVCRPLYKEADENVQKFAFDDKGNITTDFAVFSSCAVQKSYDQPLTVKRILVPVVDDSLKKFMNVSMNPIKFFKEKNLKSLSRFHGKERKQHFDINLFKPQENLSEETTKFVEHNKIDSDVLEIVTEMLDYVELKECFEELDYSYDPDVPVPVEKENVELSTLKSTQNKRKKTRLQRQIEILGGTFIAVQGEDGNEENLAQISEENKNCMKESCRMGCVCPYRMLRNEHCGKEACMFSCQCPPYTRKQGCEIKSKIWLLPEVLRHRNVSQSKLAPVEREYHQTVIMSKDKKITIETKHRKRERKLPSKYKDEILFDFKKDNDHDDHEDDDCLLDIAEEDRSSKQIRRENKATPDKSKKRVASSLVLTPETFLKNPTKVPDPRLNIKQCSVQIERNYALNKMAAELNFIPGLHIDSQKYIKSPKMFKSGKSNPRNVARKKTGSSTSHVFDVENFCSRTHGVIEDYRTRNLFYQLKTREFTLYTCVTHGRNPTIDQLLHDIPVIKEDLVEISDAEDENEIEEKSPNEEERGLQIEFVHSLPSHLFEKQDKIDLEGNMNESIETTNEKPSELLGQVVSSNKDIVTTFLPVGGNQRFVYALLPKIEKGCKWWVVELDSEKFTNLVYYSDKRTLSFPVIKKAIFDAEYNNTVIKHVLKNPKSPFEDKFGAYVVSGHKHLIFFGPYELSDETHGITAIRHEDGKFIQVPFTTQFSKSDSFKSLGINIAPVKESCQSILKAVNAVWWYSLGNKGSITNLAEIKSVRYNLNCINSVSNHDENSNKYDSERFIPSELLETETDLHEMVGVIEDDITIEQHPVKIEPFDDYEDSLSFISFGENSIDARKDNTRSTTTGSLINMKENSLRHNVESVDLEVGPADNNINSIETQSASRFTYTTNENSLLKKNVAKMKTSSVIKKFIVPVKPNAAVIPKKRKRKGSKALFSRQKKKRKEGLTKEDFHIMSLKKKIENLKTLEEAIKSKQLERKQKQAHDKFPDIDFESDSSSLSDDLFIDVLSEDEVLFPAKESNVRRIFHNDIKVPPKAIEQHPGNLPQNLLQKQPREGSCPEKALLSLTPGIGYVPVVEFDPRSGNLVIQDPSNSQFEHVFQNKGQASVWLNQYFFDRFVFKPKFDMQWVIVTGSIIRMLQPLNKDIFKYKAKSLTIRPCGLELGHHHLIDEEIMDWERRELSLLNRKITTNQNNPSKKSEKQKCHSQEKLISEKSIECNTMKRHIHMERLRRSELAELTANLGRLVFNEGSHTKVSKIGIMHRAIKLLAAQKLIEEESQAIIAELKKKRDTLNQKLKGIFADIVSHEEKKKALDLCKFIRCTHYKLPNMNDKYMNLMMNKEFELVSKLNDYRGIRSQSTSSMSSSSNSSSGSSQIPSVDSDVQRTASTGGGKKPTEGVFVKSKFRSLTASRPGLQIFSRSGDGEVIDLVDSDNEGQVIELESEEEEVIWLPAKEQPQKEDDDITVVSSNFKPKRPRLKFPKPKRVLIQPPTQKQVTPSLYETVTPGITKDKDTCQPSETPSTSTPAPVAMVLSPALMEQHQLAAERAKLQTGPEFVAVAEHDYEPLFCEFKSGCSRTDPVPDKYNRKANTKLSQQQFIPIHQLVNNTPSNTTIQNLPKNSNSRPAGFQQIKLKNMTPIGRIGSHDKLSTFKGRPVLVSKSTEGFQISKLPTGSSSLPRLTPLSATPVTITGALGNKNTLNSGKLGGSVSVLKKIPSDRADTVTLYHPVEEISVTKTVKFANLNSVKLDMPTSSMLTGPRIRKPNDGVPGGIKILLPRKS